MNILYYGQKCSFTVTKLVKKAFTQHMIKLESLNNSETDVSLSDRISQLDISSSSELQNSSLDKSFLDSSNSGQSLLNSSSSSFNSSAMCSTPVSKGKRNEKFQTPNVSKLVVKGVDGFMKLTNNTFLHIECKNSDTDLRDNSKGKVPTVTFEMIGGLKQQISHLKEMVHLPLHSPEIFKTYGKFI